MKNNKNTAVRQNNSKSRFYGLFYTSNGKTFGPYDNYIFTGEDMLAGSTNESAFVKHSNSRAKKKFVLKELIPQWRNARVESFTIQD